MRRTKLYVVLLALGLGGYGLPGQGFCADYTQHEDFGVKEGGNIVSFTVTPPGRVLSGRVDSPGGFIWMGGPESWSGTIPPDFSGVHNGLFSGTYVPPGTGGPPREYTWEVDTKAMVVAGFATEGVVGVYGGTNVQIDLSGNPLIDGRDYSLPLDFYCSGSGCNGMLSTNPAIPAVFSVKPISISAKKQGNINGAIITNGISQFGTNYWQNQAATLIPQATIILSGKNNSKTIGTGTEPAVARVTGNTKISGGVDGAGILIVEPNVNITLTGNCHYEGIIILMGNNTFTASQGAVSIFGAVVVIGDNVTISIQGSVQIMHSLEALTNLNKLLN